MATASISLNPRCIAVPHRTATLWIIILILAILVRFIGLARFDLTSDEGHSYLTATSGSLWTTLEGDSNLPLYFALLKIWIAIFGSSLQTMRILSAVAGTAMILGLGLLARTCGASTRVVTWTLLLGAFTPVQIHYAQIARGYTLGCLLLILGMWSFVIAVESAGAGARKRVTAWMMHAIVVALGAYEHNLIVPISAGYLIAAFFMRLAKRQALEMLGSYCMAALLAVPALLLTLRQQQSSASVAWIAAFWRATPPALAIPKSLTLLSFGGNMPGYLLAMPLPFPLQLLALGLLACALGAFFWPQREPSIRDAKGSTETPIHARYRPLLIVFTFWPLIFMWSYSALVSPIYIVGRYDVFAQPAYVILLAVGLSRLESVFRSGTGMLRPVVMVGLPLAVCVVLAADVYCRWRVPVDSLTFLHEQRADFLAEEMKAQDVIVCTGMEAAPTLYHLRQHHIDKSVWTFPRETLNHLGWFISDDQIIKQQDHWPVDAAALLEQAAPATEARIWIILDSSAVSSAAGAVPSPRLQLVLDFVDAARAYGWRPEAGDAERQGRLIGLRMVSLVRDRAR